MVNTTSFKQAKILWRSGKLDDAFKKYQQSIESNPNFAWSYYYLGEILAAQNKWEEAVIQYKEAVNINPHSATFCYSFAKTLIHQGQLDEAIKYLKIAVSLQNDVTIYQQTLAKVYEAKFDFVAAFKIWQEIIAINPNHLVAGKKIHYLQTDVARDFVENGNKLNKEGKIKEAVEYFQQALIINPQQEMAIYRTCGNNLITLSKFEEAEMVFQQLKEVYPELPEGYEDYARIANSLGNCKLALLRWENALEKFPEHIDFQVQKGNVLINLSRFDEAEAVFLELIEKYSYRPQGYDGYGRIANSLANWELALQRWENAVEKFPENIGFRVEKGNVLINLSRFDEAEAVFQRLKEKFPNQPQGYDGYGRIASSFVNWEFALERWENAVEKFPENIGFQVNKGNALINLSRFDKAEAVFQRLIERFPNQPHGYEGYARVANSLGNCKLALLRWENALEKFPEHIDFQVQKGNLLINLSRFDEAETVFIELIEKYSYRPQGYDGYGRIANSLANWELALQRWENALKKFPENIGFRVEKGNVLINLSRFDEAETVFIELIEKYSYRPQGYDGYGRIANSFVNWELALERWENAINQLPHHLNFYVQKGNALINLFRYREAEIFFDQLISKYPHKHHGYDGLARVSMHAQKWELALTRWQTAIDKFPENLAFLVGKANAYLQLHQFDSSQDLADRIFRQYPNHYQQKYALQKNIVLRCYPLERSISSLRKIEDYLKFLLSDSGVSPITHPCHQILLESINSFAKIVTNYANHFTILGIGIIGIVVKRLLDDYFLEISPGEILVCTFKKLIAQKLGNENLDLQQAEILCTEANFHAALDIYLNLGDEIVERFIPDYPEHIDRLFSEKIEHNVTAVLQEKYGSLQLAKEALEADLINDDFKSNGIYSQLGYLLVNFGETEKGLGYLNKGVEISIYNQDAYIKLGYALLKLGKKELAFANYKQAVKLNFALSLLSATLIELAISKSHQLINSGCQKLGVYQQLSNLLVKQGLSKEALEVADKVQTKFGDGYESQKVLISILIAQGNKQQALEYYQQVLNTNPQSAHQNLGVLRTCNSLEKFENQTMLRVILCDRFKIAYVLIPKCACSTVQTIVRYLENGQEEKSKIISMPKYQSHKIYRLKMENLAASYFNFVVVREPIKRFLSAFSNKILYSRILETIQLTSQYLSIAHLGVNPKINWMVENLELYSEMSGDWEYHIRPQHTFMGNQIKGFDRVFQVERLGELGEKLSEITGFEVNLPRINTGGRKISLAGLSEKSMKKLIDFYARDYELLKDYYSPDKIWDEYQALKK